MNLPITFNMEPYTGLDPLTVEGLRTHVIDPTTHNEFLLVDEKSIFPEDPPIPLREILLGSLGVAQVADHEVEVYQLPNDYVGLASVLNDVASSNSSRAYQFAHGVFAEIGHSLDKIHRISSLIPLDLSYEDIIIERDVVNFRILPPLEFVRINDEDAVRQVGQILHDELMENAGNEQRKAIVEKAFKGYWESLSR